MEDYDVMLEQAKEDIDATSEKLGGMVAAQNEAAQSTDALAESQENLTGKTEEAANTIDESTGRIIEKYASYSEAVIGSIQSQINI